MFRLNISTPYRPILLLGLCLLTASNTRAVPPVRPKSEINVVERNEKPLRAHITTEKGNREDSLLMHKATDSLFVAPATAEAPDAEAPQGVEIEIDKKIIYPQALGLSESNTLREILAFIPELLSRGDEDMLAHFSLQVDDQDVGESQDVLLTTLRLSEIESIEITTSPAAAAQKNGEGGVIEITLKPIHKGFSGSTTADIYTNFHNTVDASPAVFINYGHDKWQMRASAVIEYTRPEMYELREIRTHQMDRPQGRDTISQFVDTARANDLRETAKLHIDYMPTTQDKLSFVVLESMRWQATHNRTTVSTQVPLLAPADAYQEIRTPITQQHSLHQANVLAQATYKHTYPMGGAFETSVLYSYNSENEQSDKQSPTLIDSVRFAIQENTRRTATPHEVQFDIATKHAICPQQLGLHDSEMWLTVALNTSYQTAQSTLFQEGLRDHAPEYKQQLNLRSHQLYVSPVVQWDYRIGAFQAQAGLRYQMLRRQIHTPEQPNWTNLEHDFTANINAVWKITKAHSLRFSIARNIVRPKDEQLFPYPYYLPATQEILIGNDSLHAAYFHNIGMNYLYHSPFAHANEGRIITNIGIEYIRADGMIRKQRRTYPTPFGSLPYKTYVNLSVGNVLSTTASLYLRYRIFSLSFSGNVYANFQQSGKKQDYYWYYNLSLTPIFAFRHHWTLSGKLMYNSKIETATSLLGDCFYVQLRLSKDIGPWNIHAELTDLFDMQTVDRSYSLQDQEIITRTYDLYKRLVILGVVYHF